MMKVPILVAMFFMAISAMACNLTQQAGAAQATPQGAAAAPGTVVVATSSIPTSTAAGSAGNELPVGTLILTQLNNPIAQLPNGRTLSLTPDRLGNQGSPNGRYGVRFTTNNNLTDLTLVDYQASATKDIPQGKGLAGPAVTWKADSSGFAFFNFPPPDNPKAGSRSILYYDIVSGQTKEIVPAPADAGSLASSIAFSPDGKLLAYAVGAVTGEGIGGPNSKVFILDTTANKSTPLPSASSGFSQWLGDNKSFLVQRADQSGISQILAFNLDNLNNPKVLTPKGFADYLVDVSPDGKRLVVSSSQTGGAPGSAVTQIYMLNPDGSNRKVLTQFKAADQAITGLVWALDGIYYSITAADNSDSTWRIDLDGANARQVAEGTLNGVVGVR